MDLVFPELRRLIERQLLSAAEPMVDASRRSIESAAREMHVTLAAGLVSFGSVGNRTPRCYPVSNPAERRPAPDPLHEAYCDLALRILNGESIRSLAKFFRPILEETGMLRHDSTDSTALRRLHDVLRQHVYPLIPDAALPPRVRSGRATGGRRSRGQRSMSGSSRR